MFEKVHSVNVAPWQEVSVMMRIYEPVPVWACTTVTRAKPVVKPVRKNTHRAHGLLLHGQEQTMGKKQIFLNGLWQQERSVIKRNAALGGMRAGGGAYGAGCLVQVHDLVRSYSQPSRATLPVSRV